MSPVSPRRRGIVRGPSRLLAGLFVVGALVIAAPGPAGADPAGPTDYQTEIESIEPASAAFEASIVGGDSFLLVEQLEPVVIEVPGYNNEPYLRYLPDGTVERNRRSPTTYLNTDRYGNTANSELPDDASAEAAPEWEVVATNGVYAWHDHRAHWMLPNPPLGLGPGDQILDERIPLVIDGTSVQLAVASYWQDPPSRFPALAGALVAALVGFAAWRSRPRLWVGLLAGAVPALVVGGAEFVSLPAATEPSPVLWILPLVAMVAASAAALSRSRPATSLPLVLGGAVALIVFAITRIDGVTKAIIPTDLPSWVDRFGTTLVLGVGLTILGVSAMEFRQLLRPAAAAVRAGS